MEFENYQLIYKVDSSKSHIRLLGESFFERNKKNGNIFYNNKKFPLMEKLETSNLQKKELKIELIFYIIVYNKSFMFKDCDSLTSFHKYNIKDKFHKDKILNIQEREESLFDYIDESDYSENTLYKSINELDNNFLEHSSIKINDNAKSKSSTISNIYKNLSLFHNNKYGYYALTGMFYNCSSLIYISGITYWNTTIKYIKYTDKLYLFFGRGEYIWNNKNISDMSGIFYNCSSLKDLPDISVWDTYNVTNMSTIFYNCSSLISLPDISKWNTNKVTNIGGIFSGCSSLKTVPDISEWNTKNIVNMSALFYNCSSLISIPDISKWKLNNVNYMSALFYNCSSLISLPDISKWNTDNVNDMSSLFYKCSSLISLPDISKWNTNNVNDLQAIFFSCSSLISLPDISKWNIKNAKNMNEMFCNCFSILSVPTLLKFRTSHSKKKKNMFNNYE